MDDPVDHGIIRNKSDELHLSSALITNQRVDLVHFPDHLRPAPAGDSRTLLLHDDEGMGVGLEMVNRNTIAMVSRNTIEAVNGIPIV